VWWGSVPEDLGAQVPDLKDALLGYSSAQPATGAPIPVNNWLEDGDERVAVGRLVRADLKLMTHGPLVATFVFPVVTLPIIGGALGTAPKPGPGQTRVPAGDCSGR
jgi:hypothetical protein